MRGARSDAWPGLATVFDFSFGELVVCLLVALVVLGPEKLHGLIGGVGRFVGRTRAYLRALTMELERETELGELRQQVAETKRMFQEQAKEFGNAVKSVQRHADSLASTSDPDQRSMDSVSPESVSHSMESTAAMESHPFPQGRLATAQPKSPSEKTVDPDGSTSEAQDQTPRD